MKTAPYLIVAVALLIGAGCMSNTQEQALSEIRSTAQEQTQAASEAINRASSEVSTMLNNMNESKYAFPGVLSEEETNVNVRIKTAKGDIVIELLPNEGPNAASNFVYLVKQGFYNGLKFHRREEGFVIQGGDPNGNGTGGPGYRFEDDPVKLPYNKGIVAMANAGKNTNGSQFFIMLSDYPLDPAYSIFGRVIEGLDVVDQIVVGDVMTSVAIEEKE